MLIKKVFDQNAYYYNSVLGRAKYKGTNQCILGDSAVILDKSHSSKSHPDKNNFDKFRIESKSRPMLNSRQ